MSEKHPEFQRLLEGVRVGSPEAVRAFLDTYGDYVLRIVRRRLHKRLRPKFDSADFVQSVWASFFAADPQQQAFGQPEELATYLAALARTKVADATRRRLRYQLYNINRERSLEGSAAAEAKALADQGPTPSQEAMARDRWDQLTQGVKRPGRIILEMLRQGFTAVEIARTLQLNVRTIQRLVDRLDARRSV